ncbi:myocardin-related transcription factor B-like [Girardinichthys multiradiatus]|uniref:myocardin-related transcription factor B-like n=1 Tax=Girardinichthys multiradiatus TaxID=208333 RepID=UPI001FAB9A5E|nr:myocardin-related transcription factor B-like [Girardinichthys multiradiatus]
MLEHLRGINHAPFSPHPISSNMDERAIRFALERRACLSLRKVLQLKLQQRRAREGLLCCGVMPPLKSSSAFHEQRRGLEQAQTVHCHKRKNRSGSECPEAIRMHILDEKSAKPLLQAKQLQQKKFRLANDLNNKIAHRPGPMELIHKNILPIDSCFKQVIVERRLQKPSGGNSSCDEDSNDSLSPRQSESREHPVGIEPVCCSAEKLTRSNLTSPTKAISSALRFHLSSTSLNSSVQKTCGNSQTRCPRNLIADSLTQKHKKTKDNKPKVKMLKYHQYIPPDKKGDTEPLPNLDSSYARILQQQQLFLQLQILSQQQHNDPMPAPPNRDQDPPSSSSSNLMSTSSPPEPSSAPLTVPPLQHFQICPSSAPLGGTKVLSLDPYLDEMKVAELKRKLKLRRLPVSGTRKDLIERLRTYQKLSQGRDTVSSPTAGGTTEPELERAGASSKTGGSFSETSSQELLRCDGTIKPFNQPSMPNGANPEEVNSDPLGELMSSPCTDLSLQPFIRAPFSASIKQEPRCSSPAPCHFSLNSASLQKHSLVSSAAPSTTAAAPPVTIDKDKMLQEKDKQIAELTRMLWQNQRLVEKLKMQLENGNRDAPDAQILRIVTEEPPDNLNEDFSLLDPQISVLSHEKEVTEVTIKEEPMEIEIGSKILVQSPDTLLQLSTPTQQTQDQIHLQLQAEQRSLQKQVCLQDSAQQLAQQQAINRLLLFQQQNTQKQQHTVQSHNQAQETQQKPCPQRKKRSQKLHQQILLLQSEQQKKQVLLKKQELVEKQQLKKCHQQTTKLQPIQMKTRKHLPQQDLLKSDSCPVLASDRKRKHILTPLTSHITGDQESYSEGKALKHILLQTQNEAHSEQSAEQPWQEAAHRLAEPPSLQSLPTWKNSSSPFKQTEIFPGLDVLLSPLSPDSVKTAASPFCDKPSENGDFMDIILQAAETTNTLKVAQHFSVFSPSPSPLHLLLSPPNSPTGGTLQPLQADPWIPPKTTDYKQHCGLSGIGRLEDFLESTTGKPLLGVEPGGPLTLIDDLHSQMLCTASILDIPRAPMDTLDTAGDRGRRLDSKDWLGFAIGGESAWETLVPQTAPSVFSADFLDSSNLYMDWDS